MTRCDTEHRLADYHRQDNVDEFKSLHQIINYVYFHDLRKMEKLGSDPEGYKELPRSTKKQKKMYKHKKRVATMGNVNWVNSILDDLEADNPDIKDLSVW